MYIIRQVVCVKAQTTHVLTLPEMLGATCFLHVTAYMYIAASAR